MKILQPERGMDQNFVRDIHAHIVELMSVLLVWPYNANCDQEGSILDKAFVI